MYLHVPVPKELAPKGVFAPNMMDINESCTLWTPKRNEKSWHGQSSKNLTAKCIKHTCERERNWHWFDNKKLALTYRIARKTGPSHKHRIKLFHESKSIVNFKLWKPGLKKIPSTISTICKDCLAPEHYCARAIKQFVPVFPRKFFRA